MAEVRGVVHEGEEAVARLRSQLEEVQDREEATQLQLAHAIAQVKPYWSPDPLNFVPHMYHCRPTRQWLREIHMPGL